MSGIFGGKKSSGKSESGNKAYGDISASLSPVMGYAGTGAEGLAKLLGGDSSGFDGYKKATGFDALVQDGSRGITGNAAAGGLLRSGGTGKSLVNYGNTMQNQWAGDFMKNLLGLGGLGIQSAGVISDAGKYSNSQEKSKEKPGIGKFLGQLGSGVAASDPRLKHNVKKLYEEEDGLGVYKFTYIDDETNKLWRGVMADEVAELRPWALGPLTEDGYMTVNYDKIWKE